MPPSIVVPISVAGLLPQDRQAIAALAAALPQAQLGFGEAAGRRGAAILSTSGRELRFERRDGRLMVRDLSNGALVVTGAAIEAVISAVREYLLPF